MNRNQNHHLIKQFLLPKYPNIMEYTKYPNLQPVEGGRKTMKALQEISSELTDPQFGGCQKLPLSKINCTLISSFCPLNSALTLKIFLRSCSIQVYFPFLLLFTLHSSRAHFLIATKTCPSPFSPQYLFQSHFLHFIENLFPCFSSNYTPPSFKSLFQGNLISSCIGKHTGTAVKTQYSNLQFPLSGYAVFHK